uniref:Solute carrier organic anion transporter family member n=2 Tax=Lutzomyia longipalpis TaxID=7200 RepID=A0A1B0CV27_LUTLO
MTGPLVGFGIAGICLKFFVNPSLTPTIPNTDPRWVGLWWFGWLVIGIGLLSSALLTALFPKTLPDAAKRKHLAMLEGRAVANESILPASWNDFKTTLKRLLSNKVYVLCNLTAICSIYGTEPYYIYTPKYIESLYQKTPTESNFYTGTVGFIFTSIGTIASGIVVSRFKPSAKRIVQWNCLISIVQILCNITYSQLSCPAKEMAINFENFTNLDSCSANCNCDFVQYAPVCGEDGKTYISSCHAGCSDNEDVTENATKIFTNCSCIATNGKALGGYATEGACPINCQREFTLFLITMSFLRLIMATGVTGSFLLSVRCVAEKDKTISLGINMAFCSILGFLPIPVVFGAIVDSTCDLWGKTCTTSGNCWLYNGPSLRYLLNFSTCFANTLALCFNIVNSKFVKNIEIFDEEENSKNSKCSEETHKLETTNL